MLRDICQKHIIWNREKIDRGKVEVKFSCKFPSGWRIVEARGSWRIPRDVQGRCRISSSLIELVYLVTRCFLRSTSHIFLYLIIVFCPDDDVQSLTMCYALKYQCDWWSLSRGIHIGILYILLFAVKCLVLVGSTKYVDGKILKSKNSESFRLPQDKHFTILHQGSIIVGCIDSSKVSLERY